MKKITEKLNGMSVGTLKRLISDIPEYCEIDVCDIVASAWKENGYCSRGERKGGDTE